jgi:hypothetical protein
MSVFRDCGYITGEGVNAVNNQMKEIHPPSPQYPDHPGKCVVGTYPA